MTARYATREAILCYIAVDAHGGQRQKIIDYMWHAVEVRPGATREQLRRLVQAGVVEVCEGRYRVKGA